MTGTIKAAGAVVAKDVPPNCIVSSGGYVKRRDLKPASDLSPPDTELSSRSGRRPLRSQAQMRKFSAVSASVAGSSDLPSYSPISGLFSLE